MNVDEFRLFLQRVYVGPVSGKRASKAYVSDTISRCRAVERRLDLDLDRALGRDALALERVLKLIRENFGSLKGKSKNPHYRANFLGATRRYGDFLRRGKSDN